MKPSVLGFVCLVCSLALSSVPSSEAAASRPNFLIIVADDMAWSDIGRFGSEIHTPTLDELAARGVTMTSFYVSPTCSPTRAMLMTGVDNHLAGLGTMEGVQAENQRGSKGYAGQLNDDVVTLAEVLKAAGYTTLMSGKWHLGTGISQHPERRGFDKSFALLEGGASHFSDAAPLYRGIDATYIENGKPVSLPDDFYSSTYYTDKILQYMREADPDKPFLAYVAYTAPHDPLQVPSQWLDKYAGKYAEGPEALKSRRLQALTRRGLMPAGAPVWMTPKLPAFLPGHITPWDELDVDERSLASKPMEVYASMVELLDGQIRRLIDELSTSGRLENTYIVFLSDNGANGATPLSYPNNTRDWFRRTYNQAGTVPGGPGTHLYLGREWASATAAPFKLYKGAVAEGGIRAPLIVVGPGIAQDQISRQVAHITDIPNTIYELAGVNVMSAAIFDGKDAPEGRSLLSNWRDPRHRRSRTFATELFGHAAVVSDNWKAIRLNPPLGGGQWKLYNLAQDPSEMIDVGSKYPDKLQEMIAFYSDYQARVGVIPPKPPIAISVGDLFTDECNWWCELSVSVTDAVIGVWQRLATSD